ncbi:hypothetical protein PIB30_034214 [Stylosanthes scabra]|uniref:Uncharacterized protein n=1 Tax=Stylosanthes scabra TaxID=79078 RepID=A0ABU6SCX4_9FABA|nr:hypothetical protein [Stylosanthes scabra]
MADGARVSDILCFCKDGMTCGGIGLKADPLIPALGVIPDFVREGIPEAPHMVQPEDGELPEVLPRVPRCRRAPAGRGRGQGQVGPNGSHVSADEPMQGVLADDAPDFEVGMMEADYLSLGLTGLSHTTPDTQGGPSQFEAPMMQL